MTGPTTGQAPAAAGDAGPSQQQQHARAPPLGAAADLDAELRENRFAYLLQPIRDLASNWDVDIAAELEEYLEELEALTFTIKGGGGEGGEAAEEAAAAAAEAPTQTQTQADETNGRLPLNFAEAALLIQGTTCVYSKKVEYLYNLVYQALETIHCKRQREKAAAAAAAARAANGESDDGEPEDGDEDFLHMGEGMEQADDIDMDDEGGAGSEFLV
jgi:condensin-2 complex subunit H2